MKNIASVLAANSTVDIDTAVNQAVLLAAVQRRIMCPHSGVILDIRKAVYFSVLTESGTTGSEVVDGAAWDAIADQTREACVARNIELEVIDGRLIN